MQILLEMTVSNANVENLWFKQNNNKTPASIFEWTDLWVRTFTSSRIWWEKKTIFFFFVLTLSSLQLELRKISHPVFIAHLFNHPFNKYILENLLCAWCYTLPGEYCAVVFPRRSRLLLRRVLGIGHKRRAWGRFWHLSAVMFLDRDGRGPGNIQGSESVSWNNLWWEDNAHLDEVLKR